MYEKIGSVPDDRETDALDEPLLPGTVGKRRQLRAMSQLPLHLRDRKPVVLQKAGADFIGAGFERLVARTVVKRLRIGASPVWDIDQKRAVAASRIPGKDQGNLGRIFDHSIGIFRRLV